MWQIKENTKNVHLSVLHLRLINVWLSQSGMDYRNFPLVILYIIYSLLELEYEKENSRKRNALRQQFKQGIVVYNYNPVLLRRSELDYPIYKFNIHLQQEEQYATCLVKWYPKKEAWDLVTKEMNNFSSKKLRFSVGYTGNKNDDYYPLKHVNYLIIFLDAFVKVEKQYNYRGCWSYATLCCPVYSRNYKRKRCFEVEETNLSNRCYCIGHIPSPYIIFWDHNKFK